MNSSWIVLFALFGAAILSAGASSPFQVSIRLYNDVYTVGQEKSQLCNGVIVHQSYVVTTGHCVRDTILFSNTSRPLTPQMIYIVAGNLSGMAGNVSAITRNVKNITIHKSYNPITLEHDIALLELVSPLPLQNDTNVKWIQLAHGEVARNPCFVTVLNETNGGFKVLENVPIIDIWHCNRSANFSSLKRDDICSQYTISGGSWCGTTELEYRYSPDRGSALVCNGYLIGLLSSIDPPDDPFSTDCQQNKRTYAFYTNVEEYGLWIKTVTGMNHGNSPTPPTTNMYGKDKGAASTFSPSAIFIAALALVFLHFSH
ncbi:plasma kallikrein-like [Lutzomyia longipalpis]|uniref:plasma kallikrein-like n=1 Tax=Lutzomyia longipalpis TaxID=7200 RepID=UPI0024838AEB|nr:plasma kallikrein-like [Lutzomyia longipalpis]